MITAINQHRELYGHKMSKKQVLYGYPWPLGVVSCAKDCFLSTKLKFHLTQIYRENINLSTG